MATITGHWLRCSISNHFPVKHAAPRPLLPSQNLPAREPWPGGCGPWPVARGIFLFFRAEDRQPPPQLRPFWNGDREAN